MEWRLADAKNRFSELINKAMLEGPQWIRRRDNMFVVLAAEEYRALLGERPSFKDALLAGPSLDGVDLGRDPSPMRDLEL